MICTGPSKPSQIVGKTLNEQRNYSKTYGCIFLTLFHATQFLTYVKGLIRGQSPHQRIYPKPDSTLEVLSQARATLKDLSQARAALEDLSQARAQSEGLPQAGVTLDDLSQSRATRKGLFLAGTTLGDVHQAWYTLQLLSQARPS